MGLNARESGHGPLSTVGIGISGESERIIEGANTVIAYEQERFGEATYRYCLENKNSGHKIMGLTPHRFLEYLNNLTTSGEEVTLLHVKGLGKFLQAEPKTKFGKVR